ncbi:uncharacterized protein DDB_G0280205-like [Cydia strobilella]|uniref:uncharacterized protein DDB_G0280205-like n=1 Tax=Cydia strobilella TaxID=1100964 RepID=UPI003004497F
MSSGFSPTKIDGVSTTTTVTDGPTTSFGSTDEVTTSTTAGDTLSTTDSSIPIAVAYKTGAKTQSDKSTTSSTTLTSEEPRPSSVADKSTTLAEPTTENSFVTPLTTIKEEAITPDTTITPKKITTITPKAITTEESKPTTLTDSVSTTTERTSADKLGSGHEINYSVYGYLALSLLLAAIVIWISYMIYTRHQANSYVLPPPAPEATPLNHITTAA